MTEEGFKRKLTAILSADVEGYSRLMREDEEATVRTLKAYHELIGTIIQKHQGHVVDSPGDNLLAEFGSVVDAVRCAVEIQEELKARNAELPENRRMVFRIGINLGDVIEEEERIYGDGINIAARVEGLADGGGICISRTAYDQVKNKLTLGYEYLGEHTVKNITEPVRVYRVLMEPEAAGKVIGEERPRPRKWRWAALAAVVVMVMAAGAWAIWNFYLRPSPSVEPASVEKMAYPLPDKPSIAVLPFTNMSEDPKQEYFSDGMTEEIITALAKVPYLFVIARNSTFSYKGKPVKISQVAEELGVRYVLEGSFRKAGDRVRVTAQLIDAIKGHHLWAERYERELKDIFALQDEITRKILGALEVKLTEGEQATTRRKVTDNLEAYLKALQALEYGKRGNIEGNLLARQMAEEAMALDPEYARPYRILAVCHLGDIMLGSSKSPKKSMKQAVEMAQKAISLDESHPCGYEVLARIYLFKRQHDRAIAEAERAISLDPNGADAHATLGLVLIQAGRQQEAIAPLEKAIRINPIAPPNYFRYLGYAYWMMRQYEEAIAQFKKAINLSPDGLLSHLGLAASYSSAGRDEEATAEAEEVLRIQPKFSLERLAKRVSYKNKADTDRVIDALRKAGLPETPPLPLPDKPSIAVLPFTNMSEDPKQEYFVDGMTEDLITDLSKISGLFVIARNSAFQYKGKPVDVKKISRELGVRYLLEGSVRRADNKVRINAQLIDATTGGHLWAERYDGIVDDVFALQDKVTQKIVTALALKLTAGEQEQVARKETDNIAAYDAFLKGWAHYVRHTPEDWAKALSYFEKAIELDPNYGRAYAAVALTYWRHSSRGIWMRYRDSAMGVNWREARLRAREYMELAMKNPTSISHRVGASMALYRRQYEEAITQAERAIDLDSNDSDGLYTMAYVMMAIGRPEEAVKFIKRGMRLDPHNIAHPLYLLGMAHFCMGKLEKAVNLIERALKHNPELSRDTPILSAAYAHLGRDQKARAALNESLKASQGYYSLRRLMSFFPFEDPEVSDRLADGILKAGLPGQPSGYYKVSREQKLTGDEIRGLVFGRTVTGVTWSGIKYWIDRSEEGKATWRVTPGDPDYDDSGASWIKGDMLCDQWQTHFSGHKYCKTVFRNTEGTLEKKNEYLAISDFGIQPFSPVD